MHDYFDFASSIALLVLSSFAGVLGWNFSRLVRNLDKLEEDQEELKEVQNKYGREIRDTRSAIARIEGKLDMDSFHYTSE